MTRKELERLQKQEQLMFEQMAKQMEAQFTGMRYFPASIKSTDDFFAVEITADIGIYFTKEFNDFNLYPSGYCWEGIIKQLISKYLPNLIEQTSFDSEADTCFINCEDENTMKELALFINEKLSDKDKFVDEMSNIDLSNIDSYEDETNTLSDDNKNEEDNKEEIVDNSNKIDENQDKIIREYLLNNNLKAERTIEGVYHVITQKGDKKTPKNDSKIEAHYRGFLLNGDEFDSSFQRGRTAVFPLTGVIKGWQIAIPLIERGGKAKVIIPSSLGYGERAIGHKIPANSILVFDIELIDFE